MIYLILLGYWFFEHATWNGLQLADVVFPWYVCIYVMYYLLTYFKKF